MKKLLIFLSIFTILTLAFIDAKERFAELDEVAASTPAQVEMKQQLNKRETKSHSLDFNENTQNTHEKIRSRTKNNLQNSIDEMNNRAKNKNDNMQNY